MLEKVRAGEWSREEGAPVFGIALSGEKKSAAVGFDYIKSIAPENAAGQLWFVSAESAARSN